MAATKTRYHKKSWGQQNSLTIFEASIIAERIYSRDNSEANQVYFAKME